MLLVPAWPGPMGGPEKTGSNSNNMLHARDLCLSPATRHDSRQYREILFSCGAGLVFSLGPLHVRQHVSNECQLSLRLGQNSDYLVI